MSTERTIDRLDPLEQEFLAFRQQLLGEVHPAGPGAVRRTVRRRRRNTALAVAAVAAVALPVVAFTAFAIDRSAPTDPTDPAPTPTVTPSAPGRPTSTPNATRSTATGAPTSGQLLAAVVDLPDWPAGASATCGTRDVHLRLGPNAGTGPALLDLTPGDIDGDGTEETVARLSCRSGSGTAKQVVAFDRNTAGKIIALGPVVHTGPDAADLTEVRIDKGGSVLVRVADHEQCCGVDPDAIRRQWRGYGWDGAGFRQLSGPTSFPVVPSSTPTTVQPPSKRLTITATPVEFGPKASGGLRRGTSTVTITNPNSVTVEHPLITFLDSDDGFVIHAEWDGCPSGRGTPGGVICFAEPLAAGERRSLVFPFGTTADAPAGTVTIRVAAGADNDGTAIPYTGNQTTITVSLAPGA